MQLIRTLPAAARARLRRLRRDTSGVAMTEFALSLPLILVLGLGGLETANFCLATLRVSQIAMTVADNAARVRHPIDETDVNEIMIGAKLMGASIGFADRGRIILSDLEKRTTTTNSGGTTLRQWIRWQRCSGALSRTSSYGFPLDGTGNAVVDLTNTTNTDHGAVEGRSQLNGMGSGTRVIVAGADTAVMVVEVLYTYRPLTPLNVLGTRTISVLQAFNVRERTDFPVRNDSGLSQSQRSDCRLFSATVPTA